MTGKTKRRPEQILVRAARAGDLPPNTGVIVPADGISTARLRQRRFSVGQEAFMELKSPRNPRFHRLMHAIGGLAAENIDDFHGMSAHSVLKRMQLETGIGCEEVAYRIGDQLIPCRIPLSLSFQSMDESEFHEVSRGICQGIKDRYWPETTVEEILQMADEFLNNRAAA